jgi:uncharacterized protein DUF5995
MTKIASSRPQQPLNLHHVASTNAPTPASAPAAGGRAPELAGPSQGGVERAADTTSSQALRQFYEGSLGSEAPTLPLGATAPAGAYLPFSDTTKPGAMIVDLRAQGAIDAVQGLSPAGRKALEAMCTCAPWDYEAMRDTLCSLPQAERAPVVAGFEQRFRASQGMGTRVPHPPFFVLLEQHARGGLHEPQNDAERLALLRRVCRPMPADLAQVPVPPAAPLRRLEEGLVNAGRVAREQKELASKLEAEGNPVAVFARVYQHVTEQEVVRASVKGNASPWFGLACIVPFQRYFVENLRADEAQRRGGGAAPEAHWKDAFERIRKACSEDARRGSGPAYLVDALAPAMAAHIQGDLGRGIAEAYRSLYPSPAERGDAPLPSFFPVFREMGERGGPLDQAQARFLNEDAARCGFGAETIAKSMPASLQQTFLAHPTVGRYAAVALAGVAGTPFGPAGMFVGAGAALWALPSGTNAAFDIQSERAKAWSAALAFAGRGAVR